MHRVLRVVLLLGLGACVPKHSASIRTAEALVMSVPSEAHSWAELGAEYARAGRHEEALTCFERASQLDPEDPEIRAALGRAGASALSTRERAAIANPYDDEVWGDLADYYAMRGAEQRACRALRRCGEKIHKHCMHPNKSGWVQTGPKTMKNFRKL